MSMGDWPNSSGLSALSIRRECENSLRRLQTDHIDVFQMHHVDRSAPLDEIFEAFDVLRTQGKVIYFGSSNFAGWHIAQFQEEARRRARLGLVSEQTLYNLVHREAELEVLPAAAHYGVGLIVWSPLEGGMLAGALTGDGARRQEDRSARGVATMRPQLEAWERLCAELGQSPAHVAMAWLLHQKGVTAPIIGPRTIEQLDQAQTALGITLDGATLARIDEIFPGPGGAAPEAYAW